MSRGRLALALVAIAALAVLGFALLKADASERSLSGYVEGDSLFLAAPVAGTIASISAVEGERVAAGERLFTIAPASLAAVGEQARAQVSQAQTEIAAAEAAVQQSAADASAAAAEADRARRDLERLSAVRREDPAAVAGRD